MKFSKIAAVALVGAASIASAHAVAPGVMLGANQFTIGISGFVPVICRASVGTAAVAPVPGKVSLGELNEFCNSPNGYRVYAEYSASLTDARLIVDGKPVLLEAAGNSVISHSTRAAIDSRSLELELPAGVEAGSLSFRIEPL